MSFPYSQGYSSQFDLPMRRQTYHTGSSQMKVQTKQPNGTAHDDALVQSTAWASKSASMRTGATVYRVEHLASFQHEPGKNEQSPASALEKLKRIREDGGLWTQIMNMKISSDSIIMANGETMEMIETYKLDRINLCTHIEHDSIFPNLFIFSTKFSNDKVGAIHIFRCKAGEAAKISAEIMKIKEFQDKPMTGAVENKGYIEEPEMKKVNGHGSPEFNRESRRQSHGVSQRIEAFQKIAESPPTSANVTRTSSKTSADYAGNQYHEARINRDVEILNHCIDEIEKYIGELKITNEARKKINHIGRKKSTKKKYESVRIQAEGPNEATTTDIYQKFKFSFNLLAKLKPHISKPNAPELVHYLMVPLGIIVNYTGLKMAQDVMNPWLTVSAIEFLSSCLYSKEIDLWKMLGPNWNLPQSAPQFEDKHLIAYFPIFKDGWIPPEIISDDRNAAAAKSAAHMVARMKIVEEKEELKKKAIIEETKVAVSAEPQAAPSPKLEKNAQVGTGTGKYALVVYDYWAHNNKELTIRAGEKVLVLDDSRRWWLVRNDHKEQGYVPSTVLEFINPDKSSDSSSADESVSSTNSPSGTAYISTSNQINLVKVQRSSSLGMQNSEPSSPTVLTPRSIITESAQFSNPSSPREPPPPVLPKPLIQDEGPPAFTPPPPIITTVIEPPPPPPPEPLALPETVTIVQNVEVEQKIVVKEKQVVEEKPVVHETTKVVHAEPQPMSLQSELNSRLSSPQVTNGNALQTSDGVDFFIPLFKSSTADDVSRWLKKLGFDPITVERLKNTTAKELFKSSQDDLVDKLGEEEGTRLYNELQAQVGAQTRHKTMTEFQKVLMQRMHRQETIQKNVKQHQVVVKGPTGAGSSLTQEEMQKKFLEQQEMLKNNQVTQNANSDRLPEKPSFTSFTGQAQNSNQFDFTSSSAVQKES